MAKNWPVRHVPAGRPSRAESVHPRAGQVVARQVRGDIDRLARTRFRPAPGDEEVPLTIEPIVDEAHRRAAAPAAPPPAEQLLEPLLRLWVQAHGLLLLLPYRPHPRVPSGTAAWPALLERIYHRGRRCPP